MFEALQQSGRVDPIGRVMTFLVSAAVHAIAVLVLVLLPLVFIRGLPEAELLSFLLLLPGAPAPVPPPAPPAMRASAPASRVIMRDSFVPPVEIPSGIPQPGPETEAIPGTTAIPGTLTGIPDGIQGVAGSPLGELIGSFSVPKSIPPPPKPLAKPVPQKLGGNVLEGKLIRRVEPAYPMLALHARVSGIVILQVGLDEEGNVQEVRILRGHPLLVDAAVLAVRQWKYSPTLLNGEPVPVVGTVTVVFRLR